ncbi:MAG: aldo/keto reductase [Burkholderiales bacterium]|nr:aldo/keto reductase [Burkholderiales bacterium]
MSAPIRTVALPDGTSMPALGLGTWRMGESRGARSAEVAAIRDALALGIRVFDTAEMYGDGGAETVLGIALADAFRAGDVDRDDVFVVSKVYPHNASRTGIPAACARSLERAGLDRFDLYLLHWPGSHPLAETVAAFEALVAAGRIRRWGVSNFDTAAMRTLERITDGAHCASNQVWYSASNRGPEFDLLPWMRERAMPLMAYSPIDQGALATDATFVRIAARHGVTAAQVALAWVLRDPGVVAIPKAVRSEHLRANVAAARLVLTPEDCAELDRAFPAPTRAQPLGVL